MALPTGSSGGGGFIGSVFDLLELGVSSGAEVLKERERAKGAEAAALANQQTARIASNALDRDKEFDLQIAQISAAAAIKSKEVEAASGPGLDISKNDLLLIGGGLLAFFMVMQFADGK